MKFDKLKGQLYTFKNNPVGEITYIGGKIKHLFNYDKLDVELIKFKKSDSIGYFCDENNYFLNNPEAIEWFYILEGSIKFIKKNKILQKKDYFTVSNFAKDTEYIILEDLELIHVSLIESDAIEELFEGIELLNDSGEKCYKKDEDTACHNSRVCKLSENISLKLGLSNQDIVSIFTAALYHDVGKVEIEDEVLFKKGKLTDEEFEHIKNHTKYGYEITKDYPNNNIPVMIKQHHERLDGTGYPDGIKGDELLFGSQIISVADIYDALSNDRPYKKAFSPEQSLEIIYENADKHYKKEIVDALKNVLIDRGLINTDTKE